MTTNGFRVSFGSDIKVLNYLLVVVAHRCEILKTTELCALNR